MKPRRNIICKPKKGSVVICQSDPVKKIKGVVTDLLPHDPEHIQIKRLIDRTDYIVRWRDCTHGKV